MSICCKLTSGAMNTLNPLELDRQVRLLSQNPLVGTDVSVDIISHPAISIDGVASIDGALRHHIDVGNVNEQSCLAFTFSVNRNRMPADHANKVPLQVQIRYTRPSDGMRCVRVYSRMKTVSNMRQEVESQANIAILATAAVQQFVCHIIYAFPLRLIFVSDRPTLLKRGGSRMHAVSCTPPRS